MKKFFNIAGPCHPGKHYMLPAQGRCKGIKGLIAQEQYFVIHAARQTGKTTLGKWGSDQPKFSNMLFTNDNIFQLCCFWPLEASF
jgi:hypothetical protein